NADAAVDYAGLSSDVFVFRREKKALKLTIKKMATGGAIADNGKPYHGKTAEAPAAAVQALDGQSGESVDQGYEITDAMIQDAVGKIKGKVTGVNGSPQLIGSLTDSSDCSGKYAFFTKDDPTKQADILGDDVALFKAFIGDAHAVEVYIGKFQ
ncbi:MAG: hypothetical protein ACTTJ7_09025, partial [Treponema sp.]